MVVRVRFEFGDVELRALQTHLGGSAGLATHQDVEVWITGLVRATLQELIAEHYGCAVCQRTRHEDGSRITWKCSYCGALICRRCALTIPGSRPPEYYQATFCSKTCWEAAGAPDE